MRRLRDAGADGDPLEVEAARLLRAASSLELDPGLKAEIRGRLGRREESRAGWRLRLARVPPRSG